MNGNVTIASKHSMLMLETGREESSLSPFFPLLRHFASIGPKHKQSI